MQSPRYSDRKLPSAAEQSRLMSIASKHAVAVASVALVALVLGTFSSILENDFTRLDVYVQILNNPDAQGLSADNVRRIFSSRSPTSYYPVRTFSYALDYQLWGPEPFGFNLTNLLLHIANTLLVFALLRPSTTRGGAAVLPQRRLEGIVVAAAGAALWAVHPVVVEPVAWIAGREELLMTLGTLGAVLAGRRAMAGNRVWWHLVSWTMAAVACLSNAVGALVPVLVLLDRRLGGSPSRWPSIARLTGPMWLLAAATVWLKLSPGADAAAGDLDAFSPQRIALVLQVYWLNIRAVLWPLGLAPSFDQIEPPGLRDRTVWLGLAAALATLAALAAAWRYRARRAAGHARLEGGWRVLLGLTWFVAALAPTSQAIPHHVLRGDRFLYLPLVGLMLAATAMALGLLGSNRRAWRWPLGAGAALIVVSLVLLSSTQARVWRNDVSLWTHAVRLAPGSAAAHAALADAYHTEAYNAADNPTKARHYAESIGHYRAALAVDPKFAHALSNYALLLLQCELPAYRDPAEALSLAQRLADDGRSQDPNHLAVLAAALAANGRRPQAELALAGAMRLAQAQHRAELVEELRRWQASWQTEADAGAGHLGGGGP